MSLHISVIGVSYAHRLHPWHSVMSHPVLRKRVDLVWTHSYSVTLASAASYQASALSVILPWVLGMQSWRKLTKSPLSQHLCFRKTATKLAIIQAVIWFQYCKSDEEVWAYNEPVCLSLGWRGGWLRERYFSWKWPEVARGEKSVLDRRCRISGSPHLGQSRARLRQSREKASMARDLGRRWSVKREAKWCGVAGFFGCYQNTPDTSFLFFFFF